MRFTRIWTCANGHNRVYKVDNDKPFCPICDTAMKKADVNALPALNSKSEVEIEMMEVEDTDSSPPAEVYDERITKPATKLIPKPEWKGVGGYPGQSKYKKKQPLSTKGSDYQEGKRQAYQGRSCSKRRV